MKTVQPYRGPAAGVPGIKTLITAGTLAATLCGWAALTARDIRTTAEALSTPATAVSVTQPAPGVAPQATPALRVVTLPAGNVGPGAPVTVTQSSR
jgi:hypothetical protein